MSEFSETVIDEPRIDFLNAKKTSSMCKLSVAFNFHMIGEVLDKCWYFSIIALDYGNDQKYQFLHVRNSAIYEKEIQNLHFVAVPNSDRHTGKCLSGLASHILDVFHQERTTHSIMC